MSHRVTLIPGDGIGPEVVEAARRALEATGARLQWDVHEVGAAAIERCGTPVPTEVLASIADRRVALKGPVATASSAGFRSANLTLREELGLQAGIRPARTWPGVRAPVEGLDVVIVRMLAGDLYAGIEFAAGSDAVGRLRDLVVDACGRALPADAGVSLKPISPSETQAVARIALSYARDHGRRKVTIVHKATVMRETDGAFLAAARAVAEQQPTDLVVDDRLVDTICHDLAARPGRCDVLLTSMLYGDLLADLCAGLSGGLGLAPGVNVGPSCAVFEAVHGTVAHRAGRDAANPMAVILSGAMLLRHIGEGAAADRLEGAVAAVLADGRTLTYDLAGDREPAGTTAVTDAVIAAL
ncbi:MAG TPA: isocitrate/isopropylmalate family dehydrogenase [Solirubrobacteraceae bacterium]|nr:isocitrate/isopropylmalate family dehydrogenase [Solirubrobacteraceae bacterium]